MAFDAGFEGGEWFDRHCRKFSREDDDSEVVTRTEIRSVIKLIERVKGNFVIVSITRVFGWL